MAAGASVLAQDVTKYAKNVKAVGGFNDVFIRIRPSGTTFPRMSTCYGPNYHRTFRRIVTVELSA